MNAVESASERVADGWIAHAANSVTMKEQLRAWGCMYDWDKEAAL